MVRENVITFVVRPARKGWEILQDGVAVGSYATKRQAMSALADMRRKLRARGERSLIKLELRLKQLGPD